MNTKKIGIVGWKTGENSFGVTAPYMQYLSQYGDVMILPPTNTILKDLDLLVLPGGKDTSTIHYGQVPNFFNSDPDQMKDFFYNNNLKSYIAQKTPIFGICLGMQMLNIYFDGDLTQNVWHPISEKSRSELVHPIKYTKEYKSLMTLNKDEKKVNSLHHQGVHVSQLGKELLCVAEHDNLVEVLEHKTLPICGVQYHPEEIFDSLSEYLIMSLLKSTKLEKV